LAFFERGQFQTKGPWNDEQANSRGDGNGAWNERGHGCATDHDAWRRYSGNTGNTGNIGYTSDAGGPVDRDFSNARDCGNPGRSRDACPGIHAEHNGHKQSRYDGSARSKAEEEQEEIETTERGCGDP
jgi:hypothetical protein